MRGLKKSLATFAVAATLALGGAQSVQAFSLSVPIWSQTYWLWSGDRVGNGGTTIGQQGCLETCVAAALRVTPRDLNNYLNHMNGYAPGGLLIHQVAAAFDGPGGLQFVTNNANLPNNAGAVNMALWQGQVWIVHSSRFAARGQDHWVLVFWSSGYACQYMDPSDGTIRWVGDGWVNYGNRAVLYTY